MVHMESNMKKWNLGQKVSLPWKTKLLKKDKKNSYERMIGSDYICIREASDEHNGILLRVLDYTQARRIMLVCGQPFFQDESATLFDGCSYSSYSSPTLAELKEALAILHSNPSLLACFEEASMSINLKSLFWVNEIDRNIFFMKKPLCYNPSKDSLSIASDSVAPCRLTMVYFNTQLQIVDFVTGQTDATTVEAGTLIRKTSGVTWKKWVLPAVLCSAAIFYAGYLTGKYSSNQKDVYPDPVEKAVAEENGPKATATVKEMVPETKTPVKEDVAPSQQKDSVALDQYEEKDIRVRTGAYRIVGTDRVVTVKTGDDMSSIAKRTLGRGMECYIEVYNDIESGTPLKDGQTIKIPKLELKKKKG
jgi:hypothetical protein